ncbi:ABC transporter substrate-binding protein [Psychromonas hadalis]|uniref:ABC transporter substrate-binding protein n=1 Tax=Psychromonas hadalis TaxID=211669 RepID=UPI0003B688FA|nr:ABC transporter substrate-binding protein [Psychromonas hadalis]
MNKINSLVLGACFTVALISYPAYSLERGGVLSLAVNSSVKTLDPHKVVGADSYHATFHLFSTLTRIDENLNAQPELATDWSHEGKAINWTFHLNKNAKFSNGRDITAEDVKFSLNRVLDRKQSPRGYTRVGPIKEIIVLDKNTVKIILTKSYLELPIDLGGVYPRIIAKENINDINTKPISSGPFILESWTPGGVTTLVKNPYYYLNGEDGKALPYVDKFKIVPIKENTSQLAALQSGAVQMMYRINYDLISTAKKDESLVLVGGATPGYQPFILNLKPIIKEGADKEKAEIFNNEKLREAISYMIHREAIINIALSGYGTVANDQPVPPFHPYFNHDIKPKKQNIKLAKKLLKEAGIKEGTHFTLYTSTGRAGMSESATAFQQMAKQAGLNIDIKLVDIATYWTDIDFKVPFMTGNWGGRATISASIKPFYHSDGSSNESHINNPELDRLLDEAEGESNIDIRKAKYAQAQKIISDSNVTIIPYFKDAYAVVTKKVHNAKHHPLTYWYVDKLWLSH